MPGVFRPQTLSDVLGVITGQAQGNTDTSVSGVGVFAEAQETTTATETAAGTVTVNQPWGEAIWGSLTWG